LQKQTPEYPDEKVIVKDITTPENEMEVKEIIETTAVKARKKMAPATHILNRSDSTGSASGRKYLQPTLSDPQAKNEKDRFGSKKKPQRSVSSNNKNIDHIREFSHNNTLHQHYHLGQPTAMHQYLTDNMSLQMLPNRLPHHQTTQIYEVQDWWTEQVVCSISSDEED
jgi:hypothetical protein